MLILKTLARRAPGRAVSSGCEMHGFEIAEAIQQTSADVLHVEEGSLYPALQRMLMKGWLEGEWRKTRDNRRARYYKLTAAGHRQLEHELAKYERVAQAIARILAPA